MTSEKSRPATLFLAILLFAVLPPPMNGQFGSDLLDFVPPECQKSGPELEDVIGCILAPSNFFECLGLVSVLDPDLIPDPSDIVNCTDIEEPYCVIVAECESCNQVIQSLMTCIVVHSEGVDENITELVETCPLDCSL